MDLAVASEQTDRLRVVTADDCTLADLSALQGYWTQAQYLKLTNEGNRLIEFTDGRIEFLPKPTQRHQAISRFLFRALDSFVRDIGGEVFYAPLRLRIRDGKFREPDLLLVRDADDPRCRDDYWLGADLVMEVVSPDNPDRDMVDKRLDYAEAGIPEYWIVNPLDETVTVLFLADGTYREHGVFRPGAHAVRRCCPVSRSTSRSHSTRRGRVNTTYEAQHSTGRESDSDDVIEQGSHRDLLQPAGH